ncbi:uncharacterized protein PSFLO_02432 [Pseudozyma flocculosa]|uniref:Uncharacterized protein n=1 Tax=Pseudozyma flocculosa TaxID=84751 RepID=A0A5C3EYL4_9BASI|nr:uncharacterized protein PSFLO_02432 [Pseudozyma flocculosa]
MAQTRRSAFLIAGSLPAQHHPVRIRGQHAVAFAAAATQPPSATDRAASRAWQSSRMRSHMCICPAFACSMKDDRRVDLLIQRVAGGPTPTQRRDAGRFSGVSSPCLDAAVVGSYQCSGPSTVRLVVQRRRHALTLGVVWSMATWLRALRPPPLPGAKDRSLPGARIIVSSEPKDEETAAGPNSAVRKISCRGGDDKPLG